MNSTCSRCIALLAVLGVLLLCSLGTVRADATGLCPSEIEQAYVCNDHGQKKIYMQCGTHGTCDTNGTRCVCDTGYLVKKNSKLGCQVASGGSEAKILSFCALGFLLMLGKLTRIYVKCLHFLYLPSCVIGGIYGLIFMNALPNGPTRAWVELYLTAGWKELPGFLINLVFASLFLGSNVPDPKRVWEVSGPNLMYGLATSWLQMLVGFIITIILQPFGINEFFGQTLPIGFSGGHGTAAALSQAFAEAGFEAGGTIALGTATVGLISSVTFGIVLVNIASTKGWVKFSKMQTGTSLNAKRGITDPDKRDIAGLQVTSGDSIDTLAWHLVIIGIACILGWFFRVLLRTTGSLFCTFPLFPLCMLAGLLMQVCLQKCDRRYKMVDRATVERISGTGLDFLIVGAVSMVDASQLADDILPFLLLCIAGMATEILCVLYLAPVMVPTCWFENGICCFGQDTGVIAAGLMLLRMVDPEENTPVPKAFGYKQPLHSAFMGGGIITALWIPLQQGVGLYWATFITLGGVLVVMGAWALTIRPYLPAMRAKEEEEALLADEGSGESTSVPLIQESDR